MGLNDVSNPVLGEMTIRVTSGSQAVEFDRFLEYESKENWLETSATLSFKLDQREFSARDLSVLVPGAKVVPLIDGKPQMSGIIDEPQATVTAKEGSVVHVEARDWLSVAVDSQVDPKLRFLPSMSLIDLVLTALGPAGVKSIVADDVANLNVMTGKPTALSAPGSTSKAAPPGSAAALAQAQAAFAARYKSKKSGAATKHFTLGLEKPYPNEGLFTFVSRVAQRFGLWVRPFVDGETVSLAAPNFTQGASYGIYHALSAPKNLQNNVLRGTFTRSRKDQPSIIYASGFGGGGNFAVSRLRAGIVNLAVNADNSKILSAYSDVPLVAIDPITAAFPPIFDSVARPAFLYDSESHTQDQLEAFLRRELSLRMRKALTARYELMGHKINGSPVAVDTIAALLDEQPLAQWNGPMWVLGREYRKDPRGGARTTVDLVLPGSIQF